MADVNKIIHSLEIDTARFLARVKELRPLIDEMVFEVSVKHAQVTEMVDMRQVGDDVLPELNKILGQYETNVEYAYARHQSADERLLESTVHLNMLLCTLQQISAHGSVFDRLINSKKATTNDNV